MQYEKHRLFDLEDERLKKIRFSCWVLILVMLFFILPTYNLVQSYQTLLERRQKLVELQEKYDELSREKEYQENLSKRLKDDDYAAKYARAKYFYAKEGETIYNIPDLLPQ